VHLFNIICSFLLETQLCTESLFPGWLLELTVTVAFVRLALVY